MPGSELSVGMSEAVCAFHALDESQEHGYRVDEWARNQEDQGDHGRERAHCHGGGHLWKGQSFREAGYDAVAGETSPPELAAYVP